MKIHINTKEKIVDDSISLKSLLTNLSIPQEKTIISINGEPLQKKDIDFYILSEGDLVEFFSFVGGG